ncbi:MAG: hypothetical protein ACIAS6_05845 [Phycisphaerales bacterium JB060]
MYHLAEEFAIWVFSLSIDEAALLRRIENWYYLVQLPFFAMACCTCFYWGSLRRDTDAISRFMVWLHATRRRALLFSLVYLLYALPLAGAALAEHAAYHSPRVQPAYELAAQEGRLPKDAAPTSGSIRIAKRGQYLRIFHFAAPFIGLPCAILGQVFWWCGHSRLRRFQNQ